MPNGRYQVITPRPLAQPPTLSLSNLGDNMDCRVPTRLQRSLIVADDQAQMANKCVSRRHGYRSRDRCRVS